MRQQHRYSCICCSVVLAILFSGEECKRTGCNVISDESGLMAGNHCLHVSAAANERSQRRKVEESMKLQPVQSQRRGGIQKEDGWGMDGGSRRAGSADRKREARSGECAATKSLPSVKGQPQPAHAGSRRSGGRPAVAH